MNIKVARTFRSKVFLYILSMFLVILIAFFGYVSRTQKSSEFKSAENYNKNVIGSINSNFSIQHDNTYEMVKRIAGMSTAMHVMYQKDIDDNRNAIDNATLLKEFNAIPYFHSAVMYNNKTKAFEYLNCKENDMRGIKDDILSRGEQVLSLRPYINEISSAFRTEYVITYYVYEFTDGNTMDGAIAVNIKLDWFNNTVSSLNTEDMNIILCDGAGNVLYDYKRQYKYRQPIAYKLNNLMDIDSSQSGGTLKRYDGVRNFVNVDELPYTNYYVVCEREYKVLSMEHIGQILTDFVIFLLLLAIGIVIARVISRNISAPVEKIKKHMSRELDIDVADRDVFKCISDIVDRSVNDSLLMNEMKSFVDSVNQQEHLRMLIQSEEETAPQDGVYEELVEFFGDSPIVGVEISFKNSIKSDEINTICRAFFEEKYKFVTVEHNVFMLIIKLDTVNAEQINENVEALQAKLIASTNQQPSIFISSVYGFDQIREAYDEIKIIRQYELLYGSGCILNREIIRESAPQTDAVYPKEEENKIFKAIINKNIEATEQLFDEFLQKIILMDVNDCKMALRRLSFGILELYENEASRSDGSYEAIVRIINRVENVNNMSEVCKCFTELFGICCGEEKCGTEKVSNSVVKSILDCIERNYSKPELNVEMMAEQLKLSPSYVSKRFKKEMGTSVSKYLKTYRLQKAIEYLNNPDFDVKSIVGKVGFVSESNFYKTFKDYYLMTPNDYRKTNISL